MTEKQTVKEKAHREDPTVSVGYDIDAEEAKTGSKGQSKGKGKAAVQAQADRVADQGDAKGIDQGPGEIDDRGASSSDVSGPEGGEGQDRDHGQGQDDGSGGDDGDDPGGSSEGIWTGRHDGKRNSGIQQEFLGDGEGPAAGLPGKAVHRHSGLDEGRA